MLLNGSKMKNSTNGFLTQMKPDITRASICVQKLTETNNQQPTTYNRQPDNRKAMKTSVKPLQRIKQISANARDRFLRPHSMVVAGKTPFDIVATADLASVRHYHALTESHIEIDGKQVEVRKDTHAVPVVIVAPLAVNMYIYDLFPHRSFVKHLLANGHDVYLIDWGKPGVRQAGYTLSNYMFDMLPQCMDAIREHSGKDRLSLHGWSMGGMLAAVYAATTRHDDVQNLIMLGTPFDGHSNGQLGVYYKRVHKLMRRTGLNLRAMPAWMTYSPGWMNVIGFKMMDPVASAKGYLNLALKIANRDYVEQHANQAAFIDNLEAYPGGVIRDFMCSVLLENETFRRGRFTVGRRVVEFRNIKASILVLTGDRDNLATTQACKGVLQSVGSTDRELFEGPGGHISILGGSLAPKSIWPKTTEWLSTRSAMAPRVRQTSTSSRTADTSSQQEALAA